MNTSKTTTLLAILVAILGVVVPIIWVRYNTTSSLELHYVSNTTIVAKSQELEKLAVFYDGMELEQLSKADFILINSGRTPITKSDVI